MQKKIRVLIADDHPLLTAGLEMTIGSWEEFEVAGTARDGEEAVSLSEAVHPDIVIMDMKMPNLSGCEAIARIKDRQPEVKVLALTTFDDRETVSRAMDAGCDGFLLKVIGSEKLMTISPLVSTAVTLRAPREANS